jgi:hypothetical protein
MNCSRYLRDSSRLSAISDVSPRMTLPMSGDRRMVTSGSTKASSSARVSPRSPGAWSSLARSFQTAASASSSLSRQRR